MAPWSWGQSDSKKILGSGARAALEKKSGAGAGAALKKTGSGARSAWERNQEPETHEEKSGAGVRAGAPKKLAGSPALEPTVVNFKCQYFFIDKRRGELSQIKILNLNL